MKWRALLVMLSLAIPALAQDSLERQVMMRLKAALDPAISGFPETDDSGASPKGGNSDALWMVRLPEAGERTIEILANPLNEVNQIKARRAMAAIERNIEAAQRRAAAQYERAVAEAKRTGKSQEVDGVTLSDEGIEGARIDAESHVTIEAAFNEAAYRFTVTSPAEPHQSMLHSGEVRMITFSGGQYRDAAASADRFAEAETLVFVGRIAAPVVTKRGDHSYEVIGTPMPADRQGVNTLVVRYRGNDSLVEELSSNSAWNLLLELMK
jgi:hypothetical protein